MPKTQIEKLWLLGGVIVAAVLALIGYVALIGPQRSRTHDVSTKVTDARLANDTLQTRIAALEAENKKLSTYQAQLTRAKLALPTSSGLPDFLRTLQSIGAATQADVSSLTVGAPIAATTAAATTATTPTSSSTDSTSTSGTADGSTATSTGSVAGAPTTVTLNGTPIYSLPITASVTGSTAQLEKFLTQLQQVQPRAVLIGSISEGAALATNGAANASSSSATLQLTMDAFVAPTTSTEAQSLAAGTAPTS